MAWIYTRKDLESKQDQMNRNRDAIRILEDFKNSVLPNIGSVEEGARDGTAIGYMLGILHTVNDQWAGVDADAFAEKLKDVCTYLDKDTKTFQKAMDKEIEQLRERNRAYAHEYEYMLNNLKPHSVIDTSIHYALGDYDD